MSIEWQDHKELLAAAGIKLVEVDGSAIEFEDYSPGNRRRDDTRCQSG